MGLISNMKQLVKAGISAETEDATVDEVAAGTILSVPEDSQHVVFGSLTVNGIVEVFGELRVAAWPS